MDITKWMQECECDTFFLIEETLREESIDFSEGECDMKQVTAYEVYKAYEQALLKAPLSIPQVEEIEGMFYMPSNWEDEPAHIKAIFEEMARKINEMVASLDKDEENVVNALSSRVEHLEDVMQDHLER